MFCKQRFYKAENSKGEEVSDTFYAYLIVKERSWIEKYAALSIPVALVAVLPAIKKKRLKLKSRRP